MSINTLAEAEQRIRQANSANEMLGVLALCGGIYVDNIHTIDILLAEYDKVVLAKHILDDENAPAYSKLEATNFIMAANSAVQSAVFPNLLGLSIPSAFVEDARKELIDNGARIRNMVDMENIKAFERKFNESKERYNKRTQEFKDFCNRMVHVNIQLESTNKDRQYLINKTINEILSSATKTIYYSILRYKNNYTKDTFENYLKKEKKRAKNTILNSKLMIMLTFGIDGAKIVENAIDDYYNVAFSDEKIKILFDACPSPVNANDFHELKSELNKVKSKLLEASPVTEEQAQEWMEKYVFIPDKLTDALKRNKYLLEDFKNDCAEFYRLTGGKLGIIDFNRNREARSFQDSGTGEIFLNGKFTKRTLFHELSHAVETDSGFSAQCSKDFVLSRATSTNTKKLKDIVPKSKYKDWEVAYEDHFFNPYVGKWYSDDASEVLSMGIQQLATPELFYEILTEDPEHLDYALGVCTAKEQFSNKRLEYTDKEKRIIEEKKRKIEEKELAIKEKERNKPLKKHFNKELKRIRFSEIAEKMAINVDGPYYTFRLKRVCIEDYYISKLERKGTYGIFKKDDIAFSDYEGLYYRGHLCKGFRSLREAQLALYLFAVRDQLDGLKDKNIHDISRDVIFMMREGEFPAWFTENTQLPELEL